MLVLAVFLLLVLGIVAGCGTSSGNGSGEDANYYTFGVAAPITGNYAEFGKGFQVATQMAADKINAAGGINGKEIKLVVEDSKGNTKESTEIARKFAQDDNILAVVGDFTSSSAMATAPIYEEAGLVQLSPTASHPDYAAMNEYMFGIMGRQDGEGPFVAEYMLQEYMGAKTVGIIYLNTDWGLSAYNNVAEKAATIGLEITAAEPHGDGEKDFSASLTKIRQTNPDTILLVTMYNEVILAAKQIKQMGWDVKVATLGPGMSQQIIDLGSSNVEGLIASTPFVVEADDTAAVEFAAEFEQLAGFSANVHAACAYDAVMLLAGAIESSKTVDRENIRAALAATSGFIGITGPIQFNPAGDITRKYRIISIEDGQWAVKTDYDYVQ
ncbi:MAG: ABC transporter substrate-binding protein [Firmicutes bacterium]|nr:ABC transporter substrate-binding protein [Bacillota bacterium]